MKDIKTFLMFSGDQHGKAKEAVDLYVSLFPDSGIEDIVLHGSGSHETPGTIMTAMFTLHGKKFMAMDSAMPHQFNFTPSMSIFVDCDSEAELELFYKTLAAGGKELMPLDNYGFSQRFGWINDRFGISWQLNLPH